MFVNSGSVFTPNTHWYWSTVIWLFSGLAGDSTLVNSDSGLTLIKPVELAHCYLVTVWSVGENTTCEYKLWVQP
jgi:hypothetical protein